VAFKAYQLTLTGVAQRLSNAYAVPGSDTSVAFVTADIPLRQVFLQALTAVAAIIYVGDSALVSATVHGFRIDPTDTQQPIVLGPFDCGPIKLSDFYVLGTANDVLVIGAIPY
jgi:hypothetical protein